MLLDRMSLFAYQNICTLPAKSKQFRFNTLRYQC